MLSLGELLQPLDPETFLDGYWEHQPLLCRQALSPDRARSLLDLQAFEHILSSLPRPGDGWLHFARGGRRAVPSQALDEAGLLKVQELYRAFADGDTLYLTKADRLSPSLGQACRSLELGFRALGVAFRKPVDVHVFSTPPNGRGFPAHRDDNAIFVVQLDGAKDWRVYDRTSERVPPETPVRAQVVDPEKLEAASTIYHLHTGDVLYLPEGWVHECGARGHSLHATFRFFPLRWADLIASLCERHPTLSASLPRRCVEEPERLAPRLLGVLDAREFRAHLPALSAQFAREHAVPTRTLPEDGLQQVLLSSTLELDTPLTRRTSAVCSVFVDDGEAVLTFPGGNLRGPVSMERVFRFIGAQSALRASDLPDADANAAYDRLALVRRLVQGGLLRVAHTSGGEAT